MKSPVMIERTSGSRKICAVPVVWSNPSGASKTALGAGRDVRCGFVFNAAVIAGADAGGVINVISGGDCQLQTNVLAERPGISNKEQNTL